MERFQYRQADVIGVQTPANAPLVARDAPPGTRIEVLHNWLSPPGTEADTYVRMFEHNVRTLVDAMSTAPPVGRDPATRARP